MSLFQGPTCDHFAEYEVRVSSSRDLNETVDQAQASTYCCRRDECITDARRWVRDLTGVEDAAVVALPGRAHVRLRHLGGGAS